MPPTGEKPANGNGNGQHCQEEETQSQCLDDGIAAEELDALTLAEGADSDSESAAGPGAEDVADYLAELQSLGNPDVMETFAKLGLCHEVCATVRDMKWNYPLSVQEESIVHLLNGEDVMLRKREKDGFISMPFCANRYHGRKHGMAVLDTCNVNAIAFFLFILLGEVHV